MEQLDLVQDFCSNNTLNDPYSIVAYHPGDGSVAYHYTRKTDQVLMGVLQIPVATVPEPAFPNQLGTISTYGNTISDSSNVLFNIQPVFSVYQGLARDAEKIIFYYRQSIDG